MNNILYELSNSNTYFIICFNNMPIGCLISFKLHKSVLSDTF